MKEEKPFFYQTSHQGHEFSFSACGLSDLPDLYPVLFSFQQETDIREKWWHIKEGDVVLDVGAGAGSYTLSALAAGASFVVAFEPAKWYLFELTNSLFLNGFSPRCLPLGVMAGDRVGVFEGYYPLSHSCRPEGKSECRLMTTIDHFVSFYHLDRVDWIKIDVEGGEESVLQGAVATLANFSPKLLIENHIGFCPEVDERIRTLLQPLSYEEENVTKAGELNGSWSKWEKKP